MSGSELICLSWIRIQKVKDDLQERKKFRIMKLCGALCRAEAGTNLGSSIVEP
jgi:hypothetical protein